MKNNNNKNRKLKLQKEINKYENELNKNQLKNKFKKERKNLNNNKSLVVYERPMPLSKNIAVKIKNPSVTATKNGEVKITHTEYLQDVKTPTGYDQGFAIFKYGVNPGSQTIFPWLSGLAQNFQKYSFEICNLIYKPICATNTTGTLMLAAHIDANQKTPSTKKDFLNEKIKSSGQVYGVVSLQPKTKDLNAQKSFFVRTNSSTVTEPRFTDCANFYIAYTDAPAATVLGEIYISYIVTLKTPTLNLGRNLIDLTETAGIINTIGNSVLLPLGTGLLKVLKGKFSKVGATYKESGTLGHLFNFGKDVTKLILGRLEGTIGAPLQPILKLFDFIPGNLDHSDKNFYEEDIFGSKDLFAMLEEGDERMVDISTDNIFHVINEFNNTTKSRIFAAAVNAKAGTVLQLTGAGIEVPAKAQLTLTDHSYNLDVLEEFIDHT